MKTALMMIAKIMAMGDVGDNDCGGDNNGEQDGNSENHCGSNDVIKNPLKTSGSQLQKSQLRLVYSMNMLPSLYNTSVLLELSLHPWMRGDMKSVG